MTQNIFEYFANTEKHINIYQPFSSQIFINLNIKNIFLQTLSKKLIYILKRNTHKQQ